LSIALAERIGDLRSLAKRHQIAGDNYRNAGFYELALSSLLKSLEVYDRLDDRLGQAQTLADLSEVYLAIGDLEQATQCAEDGRLIAKAHGTPQREGELLIELGRIKQAAGDQAAARTYWRQAAEILHPISPSIEAIALRLLG
jgi:tetratricopeptide (TPR) repeat protein